ncbi:hypothetical protein [Methylomonas sp. AM2-LC]|uniref:hypothetical protein n=1 Tax=Methylomonas sp. AM2-LC TaxID=3153301 RepID=UPI003266ED28
MLKNQLPKNLKRYTDSVEANSAIYIALEVHGVKFVDDGKSCFIDDVKPEFFSIYVREHDHTCIVCADAPFDKLSELRELANSLSVQFHWDYLDFTKDKPYYECITCSAKVTSLFENHCIQCFALRPKALSPNEGKWNEKEKLLQSKIKQISKNLKNPTLTLAQKLDLKNHLKLVQEDLRQHRLNYYDLVA